MKYSVTAIWFLTVQVKRMIPARWQRNRSMTSSVSSYELCSVFLFFVLLLFYFGVLVFNVVEGGQTARVNMH